jgi:hypothetical protein
MSTWRKEYGELSGCSWAVIVVAIVGLVPCLWGGCQMVGNRCVYSEGSRVGRINKVTQKGMIWKTWEGQMALEGILSGGESTAANVWDFSFDRQARHGENVQALVSTATEALNTGQKVKVTYVEMLLVWPWRAETDYLIQKVEPTTAAQVDK